MAGWLLGLACPENCRVAVVRAGAREKRTLVARVVPPANADALPSRGRAKRVQKELLEVPRVTEFVAAIAAAVSRWLIEMSRGADKCRLPRAFAIAK